MNHAKSLILQLSKPSEYIDILDFFANTPESCLLCHNKKNEDLVCKFDKCHHKICKNCEEMFDLRNIICPIENQMVESRLISNPVNVEKILINACQEMCMKRLKMSFKMIEFTKENYFKMLTGDSSNLCQLNVPTFSSIFYIKDLIRTKVLQTNDIYSSYYSSNLDKVSEEIKGRLDKHFGFLKRCEDYSDDINIGFRKFKDIKDDFMENSFKLLSIEQRRKIQPDIKEIFDKWNRVLKEIISTFDQDHLEDKNKHVGNALESLRQLLAFEFD